MPEDGFEAGVFQKSFLLFNGHVVWHRWVVVGPAWVETYVPPAYVEAAVNLLVIENEGEQALAFDALRLERYAPGGPLMAALAGGHAQPGAVAADLRQALLRLAAPRGALGRAATPSAIRAPRDLGEATRAYRALREGEGPHLDNEEDLATLARWDAEIGAALRRGLWPVVEAPAGAADEATWRGYAARYGGMVQAWILPSPHAAGWVRETVAEARIYGTGATVGQASAAEGLPLYDGAFINAYPRLSGGRIDQQLGHDRAARLGAGAPLAAGVRLMSMPGLQHTQLQRRNGIHAAETMVQWWMAGGDLLVLDGGAPGDDLFPALDGAPSKFWASVRPAFALGEGQARRAACAVTPADRMGALGDTHWVAAENGDDLVTVLLQPGRPERGREARMVVPVPWQGATRGYVDGVRFGNNWRTDDPEPLEPEWRQLEAAFIRAPQADKNAGAGAHGHVTVQLKLEGLTRVRLWPEGRMPLDRTDPLRRVPAAASARPETLRGIFRVQDLPPPAGYRYEVLRGANWLAGPLGGAHTSEVRPATRGQFPAWRLGAQLHERELVAVANAMPWEEESLFITFRPDDGSTYGFQLFQADNHMRRGAWGMMVYARVRLLHPAPQQRGLTPPKTAAIWLGSRQRRERLELPLDQWQLITAPLGGFIEKGESASLFYLWPDENQTHEMEVELNGFVAVYTTADDGQNLARSHVAVRWSEAYDRLWLMVEGPPGQQTAQLLRLERPARIRQANVEVPKGYAGVRVMHRPAAQWVEVRLPALPTVEEGLAPDRARAIFPQWRPNPEYTRVLLVLVLEQ